MRQWVALTVMIHDKHSHSLCSSTSYTACRMTLENTLQNRSIDYIMRWRSFASSASEQAPAPSNLLHLNLHRCDDIPPSTSPSRSQSPLAPSLSHSPPPATPVSSPSMRPPSCFTTVHVPASQPTPSLPSGKYISMVSMWSRRPSSHTNSWLYRPPR